MPTIVKVEDAATALRFVELPLVRVTWHVPAATAARNHLEVVTTDRAELASINHVLQAEEWLIE